jgi:pimeloyl-ACP methyl ester carboxylesterase
VFLPGFMLDESLWDEVVDHLQLDSAIYRLKLAPGTTTEEIATGVARSAPERFVLIGFSLGGYIARKVAELLPDRVAALVLVATSLRSDSEERQKAKRHAIAATNASNFRGLSPSSIAQSLHPERRGDSKLIARIRAMGHRLGYEAMKIQATIQRDEIAAASLSCPTLIISAAEDPLRSMAEAKELAEVIPNATLVVIERSGHMLPLEQPEVLAQTINRWLKTLES